MIRQIFFTALLCGVLAGFVLTSLQKVKVIPLVLTAEKFEGGEINVYGSASIQKSENIGHLIESEHSKDGEHSHDDNEWAPNDGFERLFYTFVANVFLVTGWTFLLCAVYMYLKNLDLIKGIATGLIGYLTFFVLPSVGLSPELPGTLASALEYRQLWWIGTVIASAIGFLFLFFNKNKIYKIFGLMLVILPHIIGAPKSSIHGGTAPEELFHSFVTSTFVTNGIFWIILGALSITLFKRFQPQNI